MQLSRVFSGFESFLENAGHLKKVYIQYINSDAIGNASKICNIVCHVLVVHRDVIGALHIGYSRVT